MRSETVQLAERGYKLLWLPSPILSPRAVCVCVLKLGCPALAVGKASLRELCTNGGCWDVAKDTQSIMGASGTCSFKSCQDIGRLIVVCLSTRLPKHYFVLLHFLLFSPFLLFIFPFHCPFLLPSFPLTIPFCSLLTLNCWHKPPSLKVLPLSEKLSSRRQVAPVWEQLQGTCPNFRQPGRGWHFTKGPTLVRSVQVHG